MIGIYILLILTMTLIVKYLKGKLKIALSILVIFCCAYCILLNIDMNRVKTLREPIFAKENGHMGSMIRYDGLGYKIGLEKDKFFNFTAGQLTILDWYLVQVQAQIDYITPLEENNTEVDQVTIQFEDKEIVLNNRQEIEELYSILKSYKYEDEECQGIFTHTIKINNEIYNILESCKEINYKGKQAKIKDEDLKFIIEIIKKYSNNIALKVDDYSITSKGAKFTIINNLDEEYTYGAEYRIDKMINNEWKKIETENPLVWNEIAYILKANSSNEINIDWSIGYGELKTGEYRVAKKVFKSSDTSDNHEIYAEFEIK